MKRQTVYVLGGVFVALVAMVALSRWWISRPSLAAKAPLDFAVAAGKDVDRVVIGSQQTTTTLVKLAGSWRLRTGSQTTSASPTKITELFSGIGKARFDRLVAASVDDPAAYGLATATAIRVTFYAGEAARLSFKLGSSADVPNTDYVQAAGSTAVWVASGGLRSLLDPDPTLWRVSAQAPATSTPVPPVPGAPPTGP